MVVDSGEDTEAPVGGVVVADDDNSDAGNPEAAQLDMGVQFASSEVSPQDWANICRLFQCGMMNVTEHRPVGFQVALFWLPDACGPLDAHPISHPRHRGRLSRG
jgi:hypothetical protein